MVRHTIKDLPPIIDTEVNLRKSGKNALKAVYEVGSFFQRINTRLRGLTKGL